MWPMQLAFAILLTVPRSFGSDSEDNSTVEYSSTPSYNCTIEGSLNCGGNLTHDNGVISSPGHPHKYPPCVDCTWLIRAPEGHRIRLKFCRFRLERNSCLNDYVLVKGSFGFNLRRLCGYGTHRVLTSVTNTLVVTFHTDGSKEYSGFSAKYHFLNPGSSGCGGSRTHDNGEISSPGPPQVYPYTVDCTWLIRAPERHRIRLTFSTFNLERSVSGSCRYDHVSVTEAARLHLGRFCGSRLPPVITSLRNTLVVTFHTVAGSKEYKGFTANYHFFNADISTAEQTSTPSYKSTKEELRILQA